MYVFMLVCVCQYYLYFYPYLYSVTDYVTAVKEPIMQSKKRVLPDFAKLENEERKNIVMQDIYIYHIQNHVFRMTIVPLTMLL